MIGMNDAKPTHSNFLKLDIFLGRLLRATTQLLIGAAVGTVSLGRLFECDRYDARLIVAKIVVYTRSDLKFHSRSVRHP